MGTSFQFEIEDLEKAFRPMGERLGAEVGKQLVQFRQRFEAKVEELRNEAMEVSQTYLASRNVRMECLSLFVKEKAYDPMSCCAHLGHIDQLAQYVLTGKKPGEA